MLTRETILAVKPEVKMIHVPEWGADIGIKKLTVRQRDELVMLSRKNKDDAPAGQALVAIIIACACDADGKAIFAPGDVEGLQNQQADVIDAVARQAMKLNGMSAEDADETKKDSAKTERSDSATA